MLRYFQVFVRELVVLHEGGEDILGVLQDRKLLLCQGYNVRVPQEYWVVGHWDEDLWRQCNCVVLFLISIFLLSLRFRDDLCFLRTA